ncbi:hypothetical protein RRG08_050569 [Elysia crispata]|uniref:Uncharacterized protein n=1 Tax=Elysia crispata TaxID=231223 RepID=A0AAE1DB12_9GAST|nr:hypothetical protein RRG08_050569 [Elysia crispata]
MVLEKGILFEVGTDWKSLDTGDKRDASHTRVSLGGEYGVNAMFGEKGVSHTRVSLGGVSCGVNAMFGEKGVSHTRVSLGGMSCGVNAMFGEKEASQKSRLLSPLVQIWVRR